MERAGVSPRVLWQRVQPQPGGGVCSGGRGTPRSDPGRVWALVPGPRRPEGTRGPAAESRRAQPAPPLRPASMSGAHKEPCHASAGEGRAGRDGSRSLLSSFHRKRSVYLENNRKGKRRRGGGGEAGGDKKILFSVAARGIIRRQRLHLPGAAAAAAGMERAA